MHGKGKTYLPLEALCEFRIHEVLPDGQEILERPLTASENFQRIVNGINFDADDENASTYSSAKKSCGKISEKTWEFLRDQIRNSLTEVCAFVDLLAVLKETKCLSVNQIVPVEQDRDTTTSAPSSSQSITFLAGKKMALSSAAAVLAKGAHRFDARFNEISQGNLSCNSGLGPRSFHTSLMELRRAWRLKIVQNTILGDASLRSIGSRAKEGGNFEVFEGSTIPSQLSDVATVRFSSTMESIMSKERCTGKLCVTIKELTPEQSNIWCHFLDRPAEASDVACKTSPPISLSSRLFLAQNILICREILSTLAYEVSLLGIDKSKSDIIAFSSQGSVFATIFPGFQLSISLHKENTMDGNNHPGLSTQMKRLLYRQHTTSWSNIASVPNPPTGAVQVPQRLRMAGATIALQSNALSNPESMPIIAASVAGFGGPAASFWMALQKPATASSFAAPVGQERYSYFNDWGTSQPQPFLNDVMPSGVILGGLDHALRSSQASSAAINSVLGSEDLLIMRLIYLARHRCLREKVFKYLCAYTQREALEGMCVIVLWNSINTSLSSSVSVSFYSVGYSSFRSRISICVNVDDLRVYGVSGASQSISIPATADIKFYLWRILKSVELRNIMFTLESLASKFLGWIQLGSTTASSTLPNRYSISGSSLTSIPTSSLLVGSRDGNRLVCIRSGGQIVNGVEVLIGKLNHEDLPRVASDGQLLHAAVTASKDTNNLKTNNPLDFRKVNLERLPGRNLVEKVESFLACLNAS